MHNASQDISPEVTKEGSIYLPLVKIFLGMLTPLHFQVCPCIRMATKEGDVSKLHIWLLVTTAMAGVKRKAERMWSCPRGVLDIGANIQLKREVKKTSVR